MASKKKWFSNRVNIVFLFFAFAFLCLWLRIAYLQLLPPPKLDNLARRQHQKVIPLSSERGDIFDRDYRLLATTINFYSVYADPQLIKDKKAAAKRLAAALDKDYLYLLPKLNNEKRFVWLQRMVTLEKKNSIKQLGIKGVGFKEEKERFYPQGSLAAHILGGVNIDNKGIEGVEFFCNNMLSGKRGYVNVVRDGANNNLFFHPGTFKAQQGLSVELTLDSQIQYWSEILLQQTIKDYDARAGSIVVINADTGGVIALANQPTYNPNHIGKVPYSYLRNIAVSNFFEPGSVFKIVTLVGILDKKGVDFADTIFCENGNYRIPGTILHDWRSYSQLSFKEVFKKSSNIGVAKLANRLKPAQFYQYIKKLGFGQKTGIELPGETAGLVKPPARWSRTSRYIIPIGQEVGVTVLQLARAIAVIANGGYLVDLNIINQFVGDYDYHKKIKVDKKRVISAEVANRAKAVLTEVVAEGTGRRAQVEGFRVGGKTGTAQQFDSELGRYSATDYRASFIGFIEDEENCYAICVSIDRPRKSHFGGVVAAPLFAKIAEKVVSYRGLKQGFIEFR